MQRITPQDHRSMGLPYWSFLGSGEEIDFERVCMRNYYRNDCSVRTGLLCSYTACWQAILTILGQDWQLLAGKLMVYESDKLLGTFYSDEEFDGKVVQNQCQNVLI